MSEPLRFTVPVCELGKPNKNGRVYTDEAFKEHYGKPIIGHLGFPDIAFVTAFADASHRAVLRKEGDMVMADVEVINTPCGKVLQSMLDNKTKVDFRQRGVGRVEVAEDGTQHIVDFKLYSVDAVEDGA